MALSGVQNASEADLGVQKAFKGETLVSINIDDLTCAGAMLCTLAGPIRPTCFCTAHSGALGSGCPDHCCHTVCRVSRVLRSEEL